MSKPACRITCCRICGTFPCATRCDQRTTPRCKPRHPPCIRWTKSADTTCRTCRGFLPTPAVDSDHGLCRTDRTYHGLTPATFSCYRWRKRD